jgi:hypothetical protein
MLLWDAKNLIGCSSGRVSGSTGVEGRKMPGRRDERAEDPNRPFQRKKVCEKCVQTRFGKSVSRGNEGTGVRAREPVNRALEERAQA